MDGGAWKATVHGVAKSRTWRSTHTCIHLKEAKTKAYTKIGIWKLSAGLFITARTWNQARCPEELVNYIILRRCYSLIRKTELSNHEKTQRNLKCILPSERSYSGSLHIMIPGIGHSGEGKTMVTGRDQWAPRAGRREGWTVGIKFRAVDYSVRCYNCGYMLCLYRATDTETLRVDAELWTLGEYEKKTTYSYYIPARVAMKPCRLICKHS